MWNDKYDHRKALIVSQGHARPMKQSPRGVVIHHGGMGVLNRYKKSKDRLGLRSPLDAHVYIYEKVSEYSGHYVVGQRVVQTVPETLVAWHAGYGKKRKQLEDKYMSGKWHTGPYSGQRFKWWRERWPGYPGPQNFVCGFRPNDSMIGIELVPVPPGERYSALQLNNLLELLMDICNRWGIPWKTDRLLTHNDVNPISRTTMGGTPWDPPGFFFSDLEYLLDMHHVV